FVIPVISLETTKSASVATLGSHKFITYRLKLSEIPTCASKQRQQQQPQPQRPHLLAQHQQLQQHQQQLQRQQQLLPAQHQQ
ncbi:unnamed protein product, partial [Rotaria sp. Silwood1]